MNDSKRWYIVPKILIIIILALGISVCTAMVIATITHAQEGCTGSNCPTATYTKEKPTKTLTSTKITATQRPSETDTPTVSPSVTISPTVITETATPTVIETKKPTETLWAYPTRTKKPQLPSSGFGPPEGEESRLHLGAIIIVVSVVLLVIITIIMGKEK